MRTDHKRVDFYEFGSAMRRYFALDPKVAYLNHGAFGAPPIQVIDAQYQVQRRMDREPSRFFERAFFQAELRQSIDALANYLDVENGQLALVENATVAINAILRNLDLQAGDEILITDQTYGAVDKVAVYIARRTGAVVRRVSLPFPAATPQAMLDAFAGGLRPRTRLAIIDHVTSPTALVLPVAAMVALARGAGAMTLVDGAHSPGMVPIDLPAIGADWYTGNCHKWLFTPRGCAFLWVTPKMLASTRPLVISHGYGDGFMDEFDWVGTRDASAQMVVPTALRFRQQYGERQIQAYNNALVVDASNALATEWRTTVGGPSEMTASMRTVRLPDRFHGEQAAADVLRWRLADEYAVQVPVRAMAGGLWVRLSAQIYNDREDYLRLSAAVAAIS